MKKDYFIGLIVSAVIMLLFPWAAVSFVKRDAGMAVCLLLFFAVNPICFAMLGIFAGKNIKAMWSLPVISAAMFISGAWIFFGADGKAIAFYAGAYLIIGAVFMLVSMLISMLSLKKSADR